MEDKMVNAIERRNSNEVESLLQQKANVNFVNYQTGNSFLHLAIAKGSDAIVKVLINYKINLDMRNTDGMTPLHLAIESFLKSRKSDSYPTGRDQWNNKISSHVSLIIVRLLLTAGASTDSLNKNGISPLYTVAKFIFCIGNRNNGLGGHFNNEHLVYDNIMADIMPAREIMKALLEKGTNIFAGQRDQMPAVFECVHTVLAEIKFEQSLQNLQKQLEQQTKEIEALQKQVSQLTKSASEQTELKYEKPMNSQLTDFFKVVEENRTSPNYLNIQHPEILMQETIDLLKKYGIAIKDISEIPAIMEALVKRFEPVKKFV